MSDDRRPGYLLQLSVTAYRAAWDLQRRLADARAEGRVPDTLILLQHPHTYTLGRSGDLSNLLLDEAERREKGVGVHHVDRGGDITYHGPGQLVGYPIVDLGRPDPEGRLPRVDYVGYLRRLEEVLIRALAVWGIRARRSQGYTGVWVRGPRRASTDSSSPKSGTRELQKIAAIGVKVDGRGVSQHGFALNVAPDLSYFEGIVPCGIHDRGVTSMERLLGQPVDLDKVAAVLAEQFGQVFDLRWQPVSLEEIT